LTSGATRCVEQIREADILTIEPHREALPQNSDAQQLGTRGSSTFRIISPQAFSIDNLGAHA
jgi:hypothetical protein